MNQQLAKWILVIAFLLGQVSAFCVGRHFPIEQPEVSVEAAARLPKPTVVIKRVVDGDTVIVDVQLIADLWVKDGSMRIIGIDTPELPTEEGKRSKQFVEEWIAQGGVLVELRKERDKYGRLLGDLRSSRGLLSETLLEQGLAKPYED